MAVIVTMPTLSVGWDAKAKAESCRILESVPQDDLLFLAWNDAVSDTWPARAYQKGHPYREAVRRYLGIPDRLTGYDLTLFAHQYAPRARERMGI